MANKYINYNQTLLGMLIQLQFYSPTTSCLLPLLLPSTMSAQSEKPDKTKRRSDMACRRCRARKLKVHVLRYSSVSLSPLIPSSCSVKTKIVWHHVKGATRKTSNAFSFPWPTMPSLPRPRIPVVAGQRIAGVTTSQHQLLRHS